MAKKLIKLSGLLNNKSLSSTNIEPEGEKGYRVTNFYFDKNGFRRKASFCVEEIKEDINLINSNTPIPNSVFPAKEYLTFKGENGYYINFYKR